MFNPNRIVNYGLQNTTHDKYDVFFYSDIIHTTVTHTPSIVDNWFSNVHFGAPYHFGLHVELLPTTENRRIAVLQLCIGRECLVFQIKHAPHSLTGFLANEKYTFFGVGIRENVEILRRDYYLRIANVVELRSLATLTYCEVGEPTLMHAEVQTLASRVLQKEFNKPESITNRDWNNCDLSEEQVQYACVAAFVSLEMGKRLYPPRDPLDLLDL